jgi:hypothetical protein
MVNALRIVTRYYTNCLWKEVTVLNHWIFIWIVFYFRVLYFANKVKLLILDFIIKKKILSIKISWMNWSISFIHIWNSLNFYHQHRENKNENKSLNEDSLLIKKMKWLNNNSIFSFLESFNFLFNHRRVIWFGSLILVH